MNERANNQCPRCGHRFGDLQMLLWGLAKTSRCPRCRLELGVNRNRVLILWFVGIFAVLLIERRFALDGWHGWLAIATFVVVFCLLAVRVQKLESRE